MKNFGIKTLLFALALVGVVSCEETPTPSIDNITLSVDKSEIIANGEDVATFTVKAGEEDITNSVIIFNKADNTAIAGCTFSTSEAATYTFYAQKGDVKSNEISVVAKAEENKEEPEAEKPIVLSASANAIVADGVEVVEFSVKQADEDVTAECTIYANGEALEGSTFTTTEAGDYIFYAAKGELKSNVVSVTATAAQENPENPENPEQPENPENPEQPENPEGPEQPAEGKTLVLAEGVTLTSGWYDVNKQLNGDEMMCWAASASNILQWWQDRYKEAGNTLPVGCPDGENTSGYQLKIMDIFRANWSNLARGAWTDSAVTWYFEGVDYYGNAGFGYDNRAYPNSGTGGYFSSVWNDVKSYLYNSSEYAYGYTCEVNNYNWRNNSNGALQGFTDYIVSYIERGMVGLGVATGVNFSGGHAVTVWGYELDTTTGLLTKLYMTDSDDRATELKEYTVEADNNIMPKIRLKGYATYYPMNIYPVSGYGSAGK